MSFHLRLKPKFWDHYDVAAGPFKHLFDFRRMWRQAVILTAAVSIMPLVLMALIDYNIGRKAMNSEILLRTSRLVSNTRRTVSYFLEERKAAVEFVIRDNSYESLGNPSRLNQVLGNLKRAFGGFTDLGIVDPSGRQRAYSGPYELAGADYSGQAWFEQVMDLGVHISEVFLGFRREPHFVIASLHGEPDGSGYIVRATIDTEIFQELLSNLEISGEGDAFIVNREGVLQTPSRFYGKTLEAIPLAVPPYKEHTQVLDVAGPDGVPLVMGYAYIQNTPFILMICKQKPKLMEPWIQSQWEIFGFLMVSIVAIVVVVLWVSTFLVGRIFEADQKRVATLHQVEYSNKLASLGRMAAGVAHEINNPLAIINEKAGLIKDLFAFKKEYAADPRLAALVDAIIGSVERCATITRRLLSFARHMGGEARVGPLRMEDVVEEVLGFSIKEASYRSIEVDFEVADDMPEMETDRGKVQQILLNLINNAFAAVSDGGRLEIRVEPVEGDRVRISVSDDGCGIPESDVGKVFEPFFSTKSYQGGTGLGLSITYGLVTELGGTIGVESALGKGTTFTIVLPVKLKPSGGERNACAAG